jgi:Beta-lactamase enzyme family
MMPLLKKLFPRVNGSTKNRQNRAKRLNLTLESLETRTVFSGSPLAADADQSLSTPTNWAWYQNVTAATVNQKLTEVGGRLIDLEIESGSPLRFTVSMVKNTGDYQKSWWWYYGQTKTGLDAKLTQHNARIQDLEVYSVNGETRYAVILVPNTGDAAKQWWWYHGISAATLKTNVTNNGARIIDLDTRLVNNTRVYDAVMVKNTGVDAKAWWYYHNKTPTQIQTLLTQNKARLVDIEDRTSGLFDVVMVKNEDTWWWYHGVSETQLENYYGRNGARIVDVERYTTGGQTRYAVALINNSNQLTTEVGASLRSATTTGNVGAYLKEVGGSSLASLQATRQFEPASMIKVLFHLHTMMRLNAGDPNASLRSLHDFYYQPGDNINNNLKGNPDVDPDSYAHTTANRIRENLGKILERMMERSDNRTTQTITDLFGAAAINATAQQVGMTGTQFASTLGSGIAGNFLTLADAAKLYEKVLDGTLLGSGTVAQTQFFRLMIDENATDEEQFDDNQDGLRQSLIDIVISEAARRLGLPSTSVAVIELANSYLNKVKRGAKGGSYTIPNGNNEWRLTRTTGGWLELPTSNGLGSKRYVYGAFVENAIAPQTPVDNPEFAKVENAIGNATEIMFRSIIRSSLQTWTA